MLKTLALAAAFATSSSLAFGQQIEVMGDVVVDIDGQSQSFVTVRVEEAGEVMGTAEVFELNGKNVIYIVAAENEDTTGGALFINLAYSGNYNDNPPVPQEIMWMPDQFGPPFWTSLESDHQGLEIDSLYIDEDGGEIQARFDATLCKQIEPEASVDLTDCIHVSGSISTELLVAL